MELMMTEVLSSLSLYCRCFCFCWANICHIVYGHHLGFQKDSREEGGRVKEGRGGENSSFSFPSPLTSLSFSATSLVLFFYPIQASLILPIQLWIFSIRSAKNIPAMQAIALYLLLLIKHISGHWECKDNPQWQQQSIWKVLGDILWQELSHYCCSHEDIFAGKIQSCISSTWWKKLSHFLSAVCCLWYPRAQRP